MIDKKQKLSDTQSYFTALLVEVKDRIQSAQMRAVLTVSTELVRLYWDIGRIIHERQQLEGWGAGVIPRLARALHNEMPELKGFSERNIGRMIAFHREYPTSSAILPQPAAKIHAPEKVPQPAAQLADTLFWSLPWFHHVILMEKVKDLPTRRWYMEQTLKDPYIFDFLTLEEPFHERELETSLIRHLEKFLLELGSGFAFVGRQVHLEVGEEDFYIDLLFYHIKLRCFIVIELKTGSFKADYAGKMNFYLNVVDDRLRHPLDESSIGLILCQKKNKVLAEYALRGMTKAIGVSEYQLTRALPKALRSSLPSIKEIAAG